MEQSNGHQSAATLARVHFSTKREKRARAAVAGTAPECRGNHMDANSQLLLIGPEGGLIVCTLGLFLGCESKQGCHGLRDPAEMVAEHGIQGKLSGAEKVKREDPAGVCYGPPCPRPVVVPTELKTGIKMTVAFRSKGRGANGGTGRPPSTYRNRKTFASAREQGTPWCCRIWPRTQRKAKMRRNDAHGRAMPPLFGWVQHRRGSVTLNTKYELIGAAVQYATSKSKNSVRFRSVGPSGNENPALVAWTDLPKTSITPLNARWLSCTCTLGCRSLTTDLVIRA